MSNKIELQIPDLGDFSDVEVIELLVSPGDEVALEDGLLSLETDKAAMDVPAELAGTLVEFRVAVGDRVNQGDVFAVIETAAASDESVAAPPAATSTTDTQVLAPNVAALAGAAPQSIDLVVPDVGDFTDVEVIEVLVSPGDEIAVDDSLLTLETDKASMDIPATAAGVVTSVMVEVGGKVNQGDVIVQIDGHSGGSEEASAPEPQAPVSAPAPKPVDDPAPAAPAKASGGLPPIDEVGFSKSHATPSVRKLARELGVSLERVKGTGRKGRISHDDVKAWVKQALAGGTGASGGAGLPALPTVDFSQFGPTELKPLTRIQKVSGPRLQASWVNLPHVTQHDLADITEMEARRQQLKVRAKERGIGLTPLAFVMRAVIRTLDDYPTLAASLAPDGKSLVMKQYRHLGFAADTPDGLVVPVIRDADRMDVYELAEALGELSGAARAGKLKLDQMQGAVFTISSLGGIGGTAFTPIVNAPEVAILGVSRSTMQPVWDGETFQPRLMLPLSLSYDHRAIDGAMAVRFTTRLGEYLADPAGLLEATP